MSDYSPIQLRAKPGIQRDGTQYDSDCWTDGQWVRWQNGRPKKMGGYRAQSNTVRGLVHGMHSYHRDSTDYCHLGWSGGLDAIRLPPNGNASIIYDRTPVGLVVSPDNLWQFDVTRDTILNKFYLVAHAGKNGASIDSSTDSKIWYGELTDFNTPLVDTGTVPVSGGIISVAPYVLAFGNEGYVQWNVANKVNDWAGLGSGEAYVTGQKIVQGLRVRGGGPSALLWSLDSLVHATFTGGSTVWAFDTISDQCSILSSQSVIEYDGVFYWAGLGRFLQFNGVVREVPNTMNIDWMFDNINWDAVEKVFAYKVARYGEIWWCYPRGSATECTHAVVYNVRENSWYDTELPNGGRSAGSQVFVEPYPILIGSQPDLTSGLYNLWRHESGRDEQPYRGASQAIRSFVTTNEISLVGMDEKPVNKAVSTHLLEPDIAQVGDIKVTVTGRSNARAAEFSTEHVIPASPATSQEQVLGLKDTHRFVRLQFESNVLGGHYYFGKNLLHIKPTDGRVLG